MGALVGFTPLENWTVQNVEEWLISVGLKSAARQFVENGGAVQVESGCDAKLESAWFQPLNPVYP